MKEPRWGKLFVFEVLFFEDFYVSLPEISNSMHTINHKHGYWTKERCFEEALKYETRSAFHFNSSGAYNAAYVHGWLDEVCSHMKILKTHYTKKECAIEALKYETKTDFMEKSPIYYSHAIRKGYINEICGHMKKLGNPEERSIYPKSVIRDLSCSIF